MRNDLYKVERDLRSIAKRYNSVKYSLGLAVLFLMLGGGAFSQEINDGNVTTSTIPTREQITSVVKDWFLVNPFLLVFYQIFLKKWN